MKYISNLFVLMLLISNSFASDSDLQYGAITEVSVFAKTIMIMDKEYRISNSTLLVSDKSKVKSDLTIRDIRPGFSVEFKSKDGLTPLITYLRPILP